MFCDCVLAREEKTMSNNLVKITVELTDQEAWDLAQFNKRVGFNGFRECAADDNEAYRMRDAADKLRQALADAGYVPR
jgi:cytochrome c